MNLCYHLAFLKRLLNLYIPIKFVWKLNWRNLRFKDPTCQWSSGQTRRNKQTIYAYLWQLQLVSTVEGCSDFEIRFIKWSRGLARAGLASHQVSSSFSLVMQLSCRSICYLLNKIPWDHSSATRWTPELLCLHNDNNSLEAREPCCRAEVLSSSPLRQLLVGMVSVRQALHTPHLSLPKPKELSPLKSSISSYLPLSLSVLLTLLVVQGHEMQPPIRYEHVNWRLNNSSIPFGL